MKYTISFTENLYQGLVDHLFRDRSVERGAYLLCRLAITDSETRLLARRMIPVKDEHIEEASSHHMKISNKSFLPVLKQAAQGKECFVWVHSHPSSVSEHSTQDDREEAKLFRTVYARIRHPSAVHASLVLSSPNKPVARVWLPDLSTNPVERVRIVGNRLRFIFNEEADEAIQELFDRQVRAFGKDIQHLLGRLHVGIVGAGGTGSSVIAQLIRLGVGRLTVADGQELELSNINRVYGSRVQDVGVEKVEIAEREARAIGMGTEVRTVPEDITHKPACSNLRDCDVIFGCTDDEWGRSILCSVATYYYIPVFDLGIKIDASEGGEIRSIQGRVTTLIPGTACLYCRGRIDTERVRAESLRRSSPDHYEDLRKQRYAPELEEPDPAVISFTTAVAAGAVSEFLHRLTGFMGANRRSSETLFLLDQARVRTNANPPQEDCACTDPVRLGRGDVEPLLDLTWRTA